MTQENRLDQHDTDVDVAAVTCIFAEEANSFERRNISWGHRAMFYD